MKYSHFFIFCCFSSLLLTSCMETKSKVEGERLPVFKTGLPELKEQVLLPSTEKALQETHWNTLNRETSYVNTISYLAEKPKLLWKKDIGKGTSSDRFLLASPIIYNGTLFALDSALHLTALNLQSGKVIFEKSLQEEADIDTPAKGIGLAAQEGKLYVLTGLKKVLCLSTKDGTRLWETKIEDMARSAPIFSKENLIFTTLTNKLIALNKTTGKLAFQAQAEIEQTHFLKSASPSKKDSLILAPFSSGQVIAYTLSGQEVWKKRVTARKSYNNQLNLDHITASPRFMGTTAFLFGNSNALISVDMKTGKENWRAHIGTQSQPFLNAEYLFLISNTNKVIALNAKTGKILWTYASLDAKASFYGPLLLKNRLLIAGSNGKVFILSPKTGEFIEDFTLSSGTHFSPIIDKGILVFLTDDGVLEAYK
ncbi:MAG: hypothetical protein EOM53_00205 [Alphaproteobacteria bacterium]|nr:hypothetical protein [Alphaproteobacteria bacterium]